jgi:hypothetical protein
MRDLVQTTARGFRLNQHRGQRLAWASKARFTFVIAGTQGGKTTWGTWWLWNKMRVMGPGDYMAVTATYDMFKLKMLPEILTHFVDRMGGWSYAPSTGVLSDGNGTRLILRSAESRGGLESATIKAAWLDECGQDRFTLPAWEAIQRRLSISQGPVLGTTTPYNLGWLKVMVYDRWQAGDPDYNVIQFSSTMNPVFPMAEYERARATLPEWKFRMFYDGQFTRPAGMIYSDFSDTENKCQPFKIPLAWPRYVGVDFGAVHTAVVWLAHDVQNDRFFLYDSSIAGDMTTSEHVAAALEKVAQIPGTPTAWFGGAPGETQQRADWSSHGLAVERPAIYDVEAGIDRVIGLIKRRKLIVFGDQYAVLDEMGRYSRVVGLDGHPTEAISDKSDYHLLDALRYAVIGATDETGAAYTAPNPLLVRRG